MKVLHVINSLHFGGAEKLLLDTVPQFKKQGLDVAVLVLHNEKTFFYETLKNKHKVKIIAPKKTKSLYSVSHFLWIRKHIQQYNIIHAHLFPSFYWVAFATLFLRNKPVLITTEHNTKNRRRSSFIFKYLDAFIYKKYSKIIAISEGVSKNIASYLHTSTEKIRLINNGIDTLLFQESIGYQKKQFNIPNNTKIVIQVASFTAQKDHNTLLKAIALLPENIHLFLVGDGVLIEEKKTLTSSLKIENRVHFLGYRSDIPQLLKTADICVLSSFYEGFGLSIVEGMASKKPCIASDVHGLSEIVKKAGLLFNVEDHVQLKEKIQALLSDKTYYNKIAEKCFNRSKDYEVSLMISKLINLYKNQIF